MDQSSSLLHPSWQHKWSSFTYNFYFMLSLLLSNFEAIYVHIGCILSKVLQSISLFTTLNLSRRMVGRGWYFEFDLALSIFFMTSFSQNKLESGFISFILSIPLCQTKTFFEQNLTKLPFNKNLPKSIK